MSYNHPLLRFGDTAGGFGGAATLASRLTAFWNFTAATTNTDQTGRGNTLTLNGSPSFVSPVNDALNCVAASSQYANINDNADVSLNTGDVTIFGEVYFTAIGTTHYLFSKGVTGGAGTAGEIAMYRLAGDNKLYAVARRADDAGAAQLLNAVVTAASTWYWFAVTYNAATTTLNLRVNATNGAGVTVPGGINPAGTAGFFVGRNGNATFLHNGAIRNFGIATGVLTNAQLNTIYNGGVPLNYAGIVAAG